MVRDGKLYRAGLVRADVGGLATLYTLRNSRLAFRIIIIIDYPAGTNDIPTHHDTTNSLTHSIPRLRHAHDLVPYLLTRESTCLM